MLAMTLALACDIPLLMYPNMEMLFPMILQRKVKDASFKQKAVAVGITLFSAAGLAALAHDKLTLVLGVVGTLSCLYVSIALPCILYIRAHHVSDPKWLLQASWSVLVLMVTLCLLAFIVVVWQEA
jgi:hypothetical protein